MKITASDFYGLYRPSECDLRTYLRSRAVEEGRPSPYEEVVIELGQWYEKKHLATFGQYVDLSSGDEDSRVQRTIDHVNRNDPILYQPTFRKDAEIGGRKCTVVGQPDFLIHEDGGHCIRDVKLSRRITEKDHPEIILQLGLYGWLYEQMFNRKAKRLEVLAGTGNVEQVPPDATAATLREAERVLNSIGRESEPYSPVGWTKCGNCGFQGRCWKLAVQQDNVAIVMNVDQGLARAFRADGILTIGDLLQKFDERSLADFKRPWGRGMRRVGNTALSVLRSACAIATGKEELIQSPQIPESPNYVMFDLEGLPPQVDELGKIYLWGIQVFGEKPGEYQGKVSGMGSEGDREGWEAFLAESQSVFAEYGDMPFVHWHHYEKTHLTEYVNRYGDRDGIAARVKSNLCDLLPITEASIVLPLPSYSLKVMEKYVGFKRSQDEYGGDWAMAAFIRATETDNETERLKILNDILIYNKEDLEATWAVLRWLRTKVK